MKKSDNICENLDSPNEMFEISLSPLPYQVSLEITNFARRIQNSNLDNGKEIIEILYKIFKGKIKFITNREVNESTYIIKFAINNNCFELAIYLFRNLQTIYPGYNNFKSDELYKLYEFALKREDWEIIKFISKIDSTVKNILYELYDFYFKKLHWPNIKFFSKIEPGLAKITLQYAFNKKFINLMEEVSGYECHDNNITNTKDENILHFALINGHTLLAKNLIKNNRSLLDLKNENGQTLLLEFASLPGELKAQIYLLINSRANVNVVDNKGKNVIDYLLATKKPFSFVIKVLENKFNVNLLSDNQFIEFCAIAIKDKNYDLLNLLLTKRTNIFYIPYKENKLLIHYAIDENYSDAVRLFINKGFNIFYYKSPENISLRQYALQNVFANPNSNAAKNIYWMILSCEAYLTNRMTVEDLKLFYFPEFKNNNAQLTKILLNIQNIIEKELKRVTLFWDEIKLLASIKPITTPKFKNLDPNGNEIPLPNFNLISLLLHVPRFINVDGLHKTKCILALTREIYFEITKDIKHPWYRNAPQLAFSFANRKLGDQNLHKFKTISKLKERVNKNGMEITKELGWNIYDDNGNIILTLPNEVLSLIISQFSDISPIISSAFLNDSFRNAIERAKMLMEEMKNNGNGHSKE
ncbi:MAG: hypothetical protein J0H68_01380 [Sphingobacteriia bacterium]|nr:hypothetical protein [Sphingobacteriia bacterium]